MFGFLKKKLKDAVNVFSRNAEVQEEQVTDEQEIQEAIAEEEQLTEQAEEIAEPVEDTTAPEPSPSEPTAPAQAPRPQEQPEAAEPAEKRPAAEPERAPQPRKEAISPDEVMGERPKVGSVTKPGPLDKQRTEPSGRPSKRPGPATEKRSQQADTEDDRTAQQKPAKRGFFTRVKESFTKKTLSAEKFDELFWELELAMLESNVAVEVIEKIKEDLKHELTEGKVSRLGLQELVMQQLKQSIDELLSVPTYNLAHTVRDSKKRPYVIMFLGVNGGGKTTTLAKVANKFMNHDLTCVIAASDTFRAAAIDQLQAHAKKLGVKMISQGYEADPAAVAYDAVEHAKAKELDVVLIDTAGRLHSNKNLMAELEKVTRVAKPDLKLFVGESITGNDCVEQAKQFDALIGIDAIILSKADVDEKGGAALSVSYVTKKPILYLGTGQSYGDLRPFDKYDILRKLGF